MLTLSNTDHRLFVAVSGHLFEVTHMALSDADANAYMSTHPGEGLIDEANGVRLIARNAPSFAGKGQMAARCPHGQGLRCGACYAQPD